MGKIELASQELQRAAAAVAAQEQKLAALRSELAGLEHDHSPEGRLRALGLRESIAAQEKELQRLQRAASAARFALDNERTAAMRLDQQIARLALLEPFLARAGELATLAAEVRRNMGRRGPFIAGGNDLSEDAFCWLAGLPAARDELARLRAERAEY